MCWVCPVIPALPHSCPRQPATRRGHGIDLAGNLVVNLPRCRQSYSCGIWNSWKYRYVGWIYFTKQLSCYLSIAHSINLDRNIISMRHNHNHSCQLLEYILTSLHRVRRRFKICVYFLWSEFVVQQPFYDLNQQTVFKKMSFPPEIWTCFSIKTSVGVPTVASLL